MRRPVANIPLPAMSAVCDACKLRVHIGVSPTASLPASVSSAPVGVAVVPQARKFVAAATTMQLRITTPRSCPMTTDEPGTAAIGSNDDAGTSIEKAHHT